jgi:hypothetical protein
MKKLYILVACLFVAATSFAQESPRQTAKGTVNGTEIVIDYGAPSVKGRTVWGGLEKYGEVWRAGANENTTVTFSKNVNIDGKSLDAGKYGFFIIPKETGNWVVIFNKKNDAWGAFSYSQAEDALRVEVEPQTLDQVQEQLMYGVDNTGIVFAWDKVQLHIPVQ